ncbi:MAG TPA: response regulator [Verrucomicrobiae bacterium]|jgi:CheY-like chemotaxis protein|nr:response regulator [Verrucomicrobiae bacterium]
MTILVIEDSRFLRSVVEKTFGRAGYAVATAADGQQGLNLAQEVRPDIILLDMMLPSIEGTEVLRQLKGDPTTKDIPVVVLSSLSQKNEMRLKTAGAAAYFEKSKLKIDNDGKDLLDIVAQLIVKTAATKTQP